MRSRSRSRSPLRKGALSEEEREDLLVEFAKFYWAPPDGPNVPPWTGDRAARIMEYRCHLASEVETAVDSTGGFTIGVSFGTAGPSYGPRPSKETVATWRRFTIFEDLARMSDVLFRGPILPRHADEVDLRLHKAWRRLHSTILDLDEFASLTADHRISAVNIAMMLETARPPEASQLDGLFELPDARTLASLLSLRCDRDDPEELLEMYRLVCQKLQAVTCTWCNRPFDESSSAGLFDGTDGLMIPATVPKVFVPQCGHAIHTLCFGSQLIPDDGSSQRGCCRRCSLGYAWTSIDIEPMVNAFCLLFGPYVDKRTREMRARGELSKTVVLSLAEVCQNFAMELGGLMSAASVWQLLIRRHSFEEPEVVEILDKEVMRFLAGPPTMLSLPEDSNTDVSDNDGESSGAGELGLCLSQDLPELMQASEQERELPLSPSSPRSSDGGEPVLSYNGSVLPDMPEGMSDSARCVQRQ